MLRSRAKSGHIIGILSTQISVSYLRLPCYYRSTNLAIAHIVCSVMKHLDYIPPVVLIDPPANHPPASHLCSGANCSICEELKIGEFMKHKDCSKDVAVSDGPFAIKKPEIELVKIPDELQQAVESIPVASGASKAAVEQDVVESTSKAGGGTSDGAAAEPGVSVAMAVVSSIEGASMPEFEEVSKQVGSDHPTGNTSQQDELSEIVEVTIGCGRPVLSQSLMEERTFKLEGNDYFAGNLSQQGVISDELGDPGASAHKAIELPKVSSSVLNQEKEGRAKLDVDSVPVDANIKIKQEKPDGTNRPEITVLSVRYNCSGVFFLFVL